MGRSADEKSCTQKVHADKRDGRHLGADIQKLLDRIKGTWLIET